MAKKGELEKQLEKLREKMSKNDYKEKVPVKVQEQDAEKVRKGISLSISWCVRCEFLLHPDFFFFFSQLRQSQTELEKVKEATENFRKMM